MMPLIEHPSLQALGWTLVHFVWQGAALGLLFWAGVRIARAASVRYVIGVATLAAMFVTPAATFMYLRSHVPAPAAATGVAPDAGAGFSRLLTGGPKPAHGSDRTAVTAPALLAAACLAWLAGVALLSVRLAGGWLVAHRSARHGVRPVPSEIHALARRIAGRLALERIVAVFESPAVVVPMMVGWMKPVVLLPTAALSGLGPAQLEALLAHELAHVRRHDYFVNLLQAAVETLLFYHPAVWWVSGQIRREREHCCDDLAIAVYGDRIAYVTALADLAAMTTPRLALAATGGSLVTRIRRILGVPDRHDHPSGWMALAFAALVVGMCVPFSLGSGLAFTATPSESAPAEPIVAQAPEMAAQFVAEVPHVAQSAAAYPALAEEPAAAALVVAQAPEAATALASEVTPDVEQGKPDPDQSGNVEQQQREREQVEKILQQLLAQQAAQVQSEQQQIEARLKALIEQQARLKDARKQLEKNALEDLKRKIEKQQKETEAAKKMKLFNDVAAPGLTATVPADYVLKAGDRVMVGVLADAGQFQFAWQVIAANGTVTLPIVGSLSIAGLTTAQAEEALRSELSSHQIGDFVSVAVAVTPVRR